jgi:hypothetical protein
MMGEYARVAKSSRVRTAGRMFARLVLSIAIGFALSGAGGAFGSSGLASGSALKAAGGPHRAGGKLSPRLVLLSNPPVAASSTAQQAHVLGLPESGGGSLLRAPGGSVIVYARVSGSIEGARSAVRGAGAKVLNASDSYGILTLAVLPSALERLDSLSEVISVTEALAPEVSGVMSAGGTEIRGSAQACSPIVSEGDRQLNADLARSQYGVDGTGVKVGVLSDSYNALGGAATDVSNGELPGAANPCGHTSDVTVLADHSGGEDEGRAMLQIVHDLAPGAGLAFATASNGLFDFADQIRRLRDNGARVITDDVTYYAEPMFQEGPVGVAVDDVVSSGVTYFSSAGNSNLVVGGKNVASYEAAGYRATTCPATIAPDALDCHDFDPGAGADSTAGYTLGSDGSIQIDFQWAQPWYGVTTDLDLYLVDAATGAVVASSTYDNVGNGVPFEFLTYHNTSGSPKSVNVVIARYAGAASPRLKYVLPQSTWNVTYVEHAQSSGGDVVGPSIWSHNGGEDAVSTAAVPYDDSTTPESYTSHGPVTFYYGPVAGTTPAAPLGSPLVLSKPDLAATDGGATSFFGTLVSGRWRFYGTSAAAPHAAAVAALLLEKVPSLTPAAVLGNMQATAHGVANGGTSDVVGSGLVDAAAAIEHALGGSGNTAPSAVPGTSATTAGTPVTVTLHASDKETCELEFAVEAAPSHGGLGAITNGACTAGSPNADTATVVYTPTGGYNGSDSFTFRVTDGGGLSATATISLTVNPSPAAPLIKRFTPSKGVAGTKVTITGSNLAGATAVSFGGVPATFVVGKTLVAQVPPTASVGAITVTTQYGTGTSITQFRPTPKVTGVTPAPAQVGDTLTVVGTNLAGASALLLGKVVIGVTDASALQVETGPLPEAALTRSLVVTTPGGPSGGYKLGVRPTITSSSAYSGAAGLPMTLTGLAFTGTKSVTFNGARAKFKVLSPTQLSVTVPAAATTGLIAVTNAGGTTLAAETFTVLPAIKSFSPSRGAAGILVKIRGTGFSGPATVQFNGIDAASVTLVSATEVDATVPAGATTGPIRVTTPYGTATSTSAFAVV